MHPVQRPVLKLRSLVQRAWYLNRERPLAAAASPRSLNILFSQHDVWEPPARRSFGGLPHNLTFAPIERADLSRFDLIVPLSLADASFLRNQPDHIRAHVVPLPDAACTALCHDKPRLNETLIAAGFGAHVPPMGDDLAPPFICKPMHGENSDNCIMVPDYATILRLGAALDQPGLFRQAAVRGEVEYATHFVVRDGRLERELTVAYHHASPLFVKGVAAQPLVARVLGPCPDAHALAAMLQLLEINPRIGGSLMEYFATFLRSLPQAKPSRRISASRWSWLDSAIDPPSLGTA
jgi:hypothetical protein